MIAVRRQTSDERKSNTGSVDSTTKTMDFSSSGGIVKSDPCGRSAFTFNLPVFGKEVSEAIGMMYKNIIEDSLSVPDRYNAKTCLTRYPYETNSSAKLGDRRQAAAAAAAESDPSSESPASHLELALKKLVKRQQDLEQTIGFPSNDQRRGGGPGNATELVSRCFDILICIGNICCNLGNRVEELQMH